MKYIIETPYRCESKCTDCFEVCGGIVAIIANAKEVIPVKVGSFIPLVPCYLVSVSLDTSTVSTSIL